MNKIIHKFLSTGDKFMPESHLEQPGFTYSACWPFTKHREKIQKFRQTCNLKRLHKNEIDKDCFAHDAAYSDLAKKTNSENSLKDTAYEIVRNCQYDGYQRSLESMVYNFFDTKKGSGVILNEELHKPVIKKIKRGQVYARIKDNIWAADIAETK